MPRLPYPPALEVAQEVHRHLVQRGIAHAIAGGLAVHVHGWRRLWDTNEVLVASDSGIPIMLRFETRGVPVTMMVAEPVLDEAIGRAKRDRDWKVPVIPVEALVLVKVRRFNSEDRADVVEMWKSGRFPTRRVRSYVRRLAPDLVERFNGLVRDAKREVARQKVWEAGQRAIFAEARRRARSWR